MCGIVGVVCPAAKEEPARKRMEYALKEMAYRGPDDEGLTSCRAGEQAVLLGHRRLSIIDLSPRGHQPMSANGASIVYNGEIYNFLDLRNQLSSLGHTFNSDSDTEVLLRGYLQWGNEIFQKLSGIFAVAIHDQRHNKMVLARDHLGVKHLYYLSQKDSFAFCSESRFLLPFLGQPELDPISLSFWFNLGYSPPGGSLFKGIEKLRPGEMLELPLAGMEPQKSFFYQLPAMEPANPAASDRELREQVQEVVWNQMISDAPVGVFFSGGLDSSIVTMTAATKAPGITAFTTHFTLDKGGDRFNVDHRVAQSASQKLAVEFVTVEVPDEPGPLSDIVSGICRRLDEPYANFGCITCFLVAREARRRGIKVLLSGDGGDEVFGGYDRYRRSMQLARLWPWVLLHPRGRERFRGNSFQRFLEAHRRISEQNLASLLGESYVPFKKSFLLPTAPNGFAASINYYDLAYWLAEESNFRVDRMSMQNSVEVRVPMQDKRLVDQWLPVSLKEKMAGGGFKQHLKRAFADLPPEVLQRSKWGWFSPSSYWYRNPLREFIADLLAPDKIRRQGLLNPEIVDLFRKEHLAGEYRRHELEALIFFQMWYDSYLVGELPSD